MNASRHAAWLAPVVALACAGVAGAQPARRLIVVVDGSAAMAPHAAPIGRALSLAPAPAAPSAVLLASAEIFTLADPLGRGGSWGDQLARHGFSGGQNNLPALAHAWDLASAAPDSVVLWIHGPQSVRLGSAESLRQRLARQPGPRLLALAAAAGTNRLLEDLAGSGTVEVVARKGSLEEDLQRLLSEWGTLRGGRRE